MWRGAEHPGRQVDADDVVARALDVAGEIPGPAGQVEDASAVREPERSDGTRPPATIEAQRDDPVHPLVVGRDAVEHRLDGAALRFTLRQAAVRVEHRGRHRVLVSSQLGSAAAAASSRSSPTDSRCSARHLEQHAPEVRGDERGHRGQQRPERLDEPARPLLVAEWRVEQRLAHVRVEHRDGLLGDRSGHVVLASSQREEVGERQPGFEEPQPGAHGVGVARGVPVGVSPSPCTWGTSRPSRDDASSSASGTPARAASSESVTELVTGRVGDGRGETGIGRVELAVEEAADQVEREPPRLEVADAGEALEVRGPVPGDAPLPAGRREETPLLVEADRVDRDALGAGEILDAQLGSLAWLLACIPGALVGHAPILGVITPTITGGAPGPYASSFQTGGRFSAKAVEPSMASPDADHLAGQLER